MLKNAVDDHETIVVLRMITIMFEYLSNSERLVSHDHFILFKGIFFDLDQISISGSFGI